MLPDMPERLVGAHQRRLLDEATAYRRARGPRPQGRAGPASSSGRVTALRRELGFRMIEAGLRIATGSRRIRLGGARAPQ